MAIMRSLLDNDLYKFSMQRAVLDRFPGVPVVYKFINRNPENKFTPQMVSEIQHEIDAMTTVGLTVGESDHLKAACPYLGVQYIEWLAGFAFDPDQVTVELIDGQLDITVRGPWEQTILWEVPILAIVSEVYFSQGDVNNPFSYSEYANRCADKGRRLSEAGVEFADFGTRRRRSYAIQNICVSALALDNPSTKCVGTSNVLLASQYQGMKPIGTMAHEWIMGVSALEGLRHANRHALRHWAEVYKGSLGIALTDTFGSDAFWADFDGELARLYDGVRQDSGNPYRFADRAVAHYKKLGIDPAHKTIVFSDGLTVDDAIDIHRYCNGVIRASFGIGTHFTNDVPGSKALNIVMKMVECDGVPVVKLSDVPTKATGDKDALRVAKWTFHKEPL